MHIPRHYTTADTDVFSTLEWTRRSSKISNMDGSVVFEMKDAEVPASWSQLATDIMVSKYFRKAGVTLGAAGVNPSAPVDENTKGRRDGGTKGEEGKTGPERSARQVIHRLAGCWRHWGETHGYFDTPEDAQAFYDELCHMMLHQMAAPNSPQWFNTGLQWAYGINGPAQGHYYVDPGTGETLRSEDAYTHPQPHACFIQSVDDDLVNEGGIMDLWVREARLFKYGSGTGTNFSSVRGAEEPLAGGGKSSGLMSFLKIGDRAAGAIKSGGTTRRAAKMVCLDLDHPDVEKFIDWKVREEIKVAALVEGMKHLPEAERDLATRLDMKLTYDFNGEAYSTVSGQNSNNSIRIPHAFFHAVDAGSDWDLIRRTDGGVARTLPAAELWNRLGYAAWRCADPGVQYDGTINDWHTCPAAGRINASNPCSEYMFLDNTACNLASLNLIKFYNAEGREFDVEAYEHAVRVWTIVLEISVLMAQFPSKEIAELSYRYRTLGLGFANSGAMLMQAGIPYDSDRGRAICGCLAAIMTGRSYATSAELAAGLGAFPGFADNRESMLRVMRNHRRAAYGVARGSSEYEGLEIPPVPIDSEALKPGNPGGTLVPSDAVGSIINSDALADRARDCWDDAIRLGEEHGYRNAQATVIAPTGTIGLLMDCDTTGVEPDFALVKFKKLAGGGYFKIANQSLRPALVALGYSDSQVGDIMRHVMGELRLGVEVPLVPGADASSKTPQRRRDGRETLEDLLREAGMNDADLRKATDALPTGFDLSAAFSPWSLNEGALDRLGLAEEAAEPGFDLLRAVGLGKAEVAELSRVICGTQTVEGAPHLRDEHLAVFDCANTCGPTGERFIAAEGHIRMMAATQPFISGAISKTINLPHSATIDDIKAAYRLSWELGLKANALYRDGCKLSQPLSNKAEASDDDAVLAAEEDEEAVEAAREEVGELVRLIPEASLEDPFSVGVGGGSGAVVERIVERIVERPLRRRLPDTRRGVTHKFSVAGHEGYVNVGLYDDGRPGELFITMAKEGSTIGGLMDSLGTAISVALQYGVPVESLVAKFTHQRFEPAGMTHNRDIPFAKSLVDYIFRWLGMEFVTGYREANSPQRGVAAEVTTPAVGAAALQTGPSAPPTAPPAHEAKEPDSMDLDPGELGTGRDRITPRNGDRPHHSADARGQLATAGPAAKAAAESGSGIDSALAASMKGLQADAPACEVCGSITVRNGTCYKCLNCGNSMGCS